MYYYQLSYLTFELYVYFDIKFIYYRYFLEDPPLWFIGLSHCRLAIAYTSRA
jgi:hypothetical protein